MYVPSPVSETFHTQLKLCQTILFKYKTQVMYIMNVCFKFQWNPFNSWYCTLFCTDQQTDITLLNHGYKGKGMHDK